MVEWIFFKLGVRTAFFSSVGMIAVSNEVLTILVMIGSSKSVQLFNIEAAWERIQAAGFMTGWIHKVLYLNFEHQLKFSKFCVRRRATLVDCSQLRPISLTNIIMRLFEKIVFKEEILEHSKSIIGRNQFAYKKGTNTTSALIKCLYHWLKWLDEDADFVRVLSLDLKKAFDSVPHDILWHF